MSMKLALVVLVLATLVSSLQIDAPDQVTIGDSIPIEAKNVVEAPQVVKDESTKQEDDIKVVEPDSEADQPSAVDESESNDPEDVNNAEKSEETVEKTAPSVEDTEQRRKSGGAARRAAIRLRKAYVYFIKFWRSKIRWAKAKKTAWLRKGKRKIAMRYHKAMLKYKKQLILWTKRFKRNASKQVIKVLLRPVFLARKLAAKFIPAIIKCKRAGNGGCGALGKQFKTARNKYANIYSLYRRKVQKRMLYALKKRLIMEKKKYRGAIKYFKLYKKRGKRSYVRYWRRKAILARRSYMAVRRYYLMVARQRFRVRKMKRIRYRKRVKRRKRKRRVRKRRKRKRKRRKRKRRKRRGRKRRKRKRRKGKKTIKLRKRRAWTTRRKRLHYIRRAKHYLKKARTALRYWRLFKKKGSKRRFKWLRRFRHFKAKYKYYKALISGGRKRRKKRGRRGRSRKRRRRKKRKRKRRKLVSRLQRRKRNMLRAYRKWKKNKSSILRARFVKAKRRYIAYKKWLLRRKSVKRIRPKALTRRSNVTVVHKLKRMLIKVAKMLMKFKRAYVRLKRKYAVHIGHYRRSAQQQYRKRLKLIAKMNEYREKLKKKMGSNTKKAYNRLWAARKRQLARVTARYQKRERQMRRAMAKAQGKAHKAAFKRMATLKNRIAKLGHRHSVLAGQIKRLKSRNRGLGIALTKSRVSRKKMQTMYWKRDKNLRRRLSVRRKAYREMAAAYAKLRKRWAAKTKAYAAHLKKLSKKLNENIIWRINQIRKLKSKLVFARKSHKKALLNSIKKQLAARKTAQKAADARLRRVVMREKRAHFKAMSRLKRAQKWRMLAIHKTHEALLKRHVRMMKVKRKMAHQISLLKRRLHRIDAMHAIRIKALKRKEALIRKHAKGIWGRMASIRKNAVAKSEALRKQLYKLKNDQRRGSYMAVRKAKRLAQKLRIAKGKAKQMERTLKARLATYRKRLARAAMASVRAAQHAQRKVILYKNRLSKLQHRYNRTVSVYQKRLINQHKRITKQHKAHLARRLNAINERHRRKEAKLTKKFKETRRKLLVKIRTLQHATRKQILALRLKLRTSRKRRSKIAARHQNLKVQYSQLQKKAKKMASGTKAYKLMMRLYRKSKTVMRRCSRWGAKKRCHMSKRPNKSKCLEWDRVSRKVCLEHGPVARYVLRRMRVRKCVRRVSRCLSYSYGKVRLCTRCCTCKMPHAIACRCRGYKFGTVCKKSGIMRYPRWLAKIRRNAGMHPEKVTRFCTSKKMFKKGPCSHYVTSCAKYVTKTIKKRVRVHKRGCIKKGHVNKPFCLRHADNGPAFTVRKRCRRTPERRCAVYSMQHVFKYKGKVFSRFDELVSWLKKTKRIKDEVRDLPPQEWMTSEDGCRDGCDDYDASDEASMGGFPWE